MPFLLLILHLFFFIIPMAHAASDNDTKKTHLEDIFIWKISDELRLSVQEEKQFTEISKSLNRRKSEINKKIQDCIKKLNENSSQADLANYRKLLTEYNQLSVAEYDGIKKILGTKKFITYIKIKNELTSKLKSVLTGEKNGEKKETVSKDLPPPKVIIEKTE